MHPTRWLLLLLIGGEVLAGQSLPLSDPVSDDLARTLVLDFAKLYASKEEKDRLAAVDSLSRYRHPLLAKALVRALNDASSVVAVGAAARLGVQDPKDAGMPLRTVWRAFKAKEKASLQLAVLAALRRLEALPTFKELTDPFERCSLEVQREIIRALASVREMSAVEWLADLIEEPCPENRDDPANPPAEYWKERVASWKFWVRDVHASLHDLTGLEFEDKKGVVQWKKKGGKLAKKEVPAPQKRGG